MRGFVVASVALVVMLLFAAGGSAMKTPACQGAACLTSPRSTIQAAISNGFLNYFRTKLLEPIISGPWIVSRLDDPNRIDYLKDLPDNQRKQGAGLFASFTLQNLYITRLQLDEQRSIIRFEENTRSLFADFKGIEVTVVLNMLSKVFLGSTKERTVKVVIKKTEFGARFALGMDNTGRPTVISDTTPIFVLPREGFDIQWLGDPKDQPSGFFNWLIDRFEGIISRVIASQVKKRFNTIVNPKLQGILASIPVSMQVDPPKAPQSVTAAFGLAQAPIVSNKGLDLSMRADVFLTSIGACSTKCPSPQVPIIVPEKFVSLTISDRLACCASNLAYDMGLLKITQAVPKPAFKPTEDPIQKAVGPILDAIFGVYTIKYKVNVPEVPSVSFLKDAVRVAVKVDAEVHLAKASAPNDLNDATRYAGASVSAEVGARVSVDEKAVIHYSLQGVKVDVASLDFKGQKLSDSIRVPLTNFLNWVIEKQVIAQVNELTKAGFPIPSAHGLTLTQPSIALQPGYIAIASNAEYVIPSDEILAMFTRRSASGPSK